MSILTDDIHICFNITIGYHLCRHQAKIDFMLFSILFSPCGLLCFHSLLVCNLLPQQWEIWLPHSNRHSPCSFDSSFRIYLFQNLVIHNPNVNNSINGSTAFCKLCFALMWPAGVQSFIGPHLPVVSVYSLRLHIFFFTFSTLKLCFAK